MGRKVNRKRTRLETKIIISVPIKEQYQIPLYPPIFYFVLPIIFFASPLLRAGQNNDAAETTSPPPNICPENKEPNRIEQDIKGWLLGCCGVLWENNLYDFESLAGCQPIEANIQKQKQRLSDGWDVENREDLLQALTWIEEGGHRKDFIQDVNTVRDMNEPELYEFIQPFLETDSSNAYQFFIAWKYGKDLGDKNLTAWDYCRYLCLCRWGYLCGYLDEQSAWKLMIPAGRLLQNTFDSWEELGQNYLIGRQYWSLWHTRQNGYLLEDACDRLTDLPSSPWSRYPWNLDLSRAEQILKNTKTEYIKPITKSDPNDSLPPPPNNISVPQKPMDKTVINQVTDFAGSSRVHIVPDEYPAIQNAVEAAQTGDTIFIREGIYREPLQLYHKDNIRIAGSQRDHVIIRPPDRTKDNAVRIHQCKQLLLSDLTVEQDVGPELNEGKCGFSISESTVDVLRCRIQNSTASGLVYFLGAQGTIEDCIIENHAKDGIYIDSKDAFVTIRNCRIAHNKRYGVLAARGARAVLQNNVCLSNGDAGISAMEPETWIECTNNYTSQNKTHGVGIHKGAGGRLEENICEQNEADGIKISQHCKEVTLKKNVCYKNRNTGITLHEQVEARVEECLCQENQTSGILALGSGVNVTLTGIQCLGNSQDGIIFGQGAAGLIDHCQCERNVESGLAISDRETKVTLQNNQSRYNGKQGIYLSSSIGSVFNQNLCEYNKQNGIYIQNAQMKEFQENRCENNQDQGISVWDSEAELKGNASGYNLKYGIYIQGDKTKTILTDNQIVSNGWGGICVNPSQKAILENNSCEHNKGFGIQIFKRSSNIILTDNICRDNYPMGIVFVNGARGYARGNLCERNGWAGIAIRGDQTSPVIEANTCTENFWGIILWDKATAGWGEDNKTSGNTGAGTKIR